MTTVEELRERATELEIEGRSNMNKEELEAAVAAAEEALKSEDQDEGSAVSEEEQEALNQASDDAAAGVEEEGETGTPVETASGKSGRGVGFRR